MKDKLYPYIVTKLESNWCADCAQWQAALTADTLDGLLRMMRQDVEWRFDDAMLNRVEDPGDPLASDQIDTSRHDEEGDPYIIMYVGVEQ